MDFKDKNGIHGINFAATDVTNVLVCSLPRRGMMTEAGPSGARGKDVG